MSDDDATKETIEQLVSNLPDEQREHYERLWNDLMSGTRTVLSVNPYIRYQELGKPQVDAGAVLPGGPGFLGGALAAGGGVTAGISTGLSREELERQLALLREAQRHPLFPVTLHAPSDPGNLSLAERSAAASEALCAPAAEYVAEQRRQKWADLLAMHARAKHRPDVYHFPASSGVAPRACAEMSADDIAEWERLWQEAVAGTPPVVSYDLARYCDGSTPPSLDADDVTLRTLATTALSLVLRMARGYNWRPDEVDGFEAACKAAGIEVEPPTEKSADTDREL